MRAACSLGSILSKRKRRMLRPLREAIMMAAPKTYCNSPFHAIMREENHAHHEDVMMTISHYSYHYQWRNREL